MTLLLGAIACSQSPSPTAPESGESAAIEAETSPTGTDTPSTGDQSTEVANRIVALSPLTADIVHTLESDKLVGVPGNPLLQQDARFADLPVVSQGRSEPDLEAIVALEPDLVIGSLGFHDKVLDRLQDFGIAVLATDVNGWEDLKALTQTLAQRTNADADALLARYEACLAQAPIAGPKTLVLVSRQPLLSPNQNSWAGDFLARFNLQNVTAELQGDSPIEGYITLQEEKVLTINPEALIVVDVPGQSLLDQLKEDAFWGQINATQTDQVYTFSYFGLINPGSLASIEQTCTQLATLTPSN